MLLCPEAASAYEIADISCTKHPSDAFLTAIILSLPLGSASAVVIGLLTIGS